MSFFDFLHKLGDTLLAKIHFAGSAIVSGYVRIRPITRVTIEAVIIDTSSYRKLSIVSIAKEIDLLCLRTVFDLNARAFIKFLNFDYLWQN
jgi:hypothetical protein